MMEPGVEDRLTWRAIDEARRGVWIDQEDIKAWAASLGSARPRSFPDLNLDEKGERD